MRSWTSGEFAACVRASIGAMVLALCLAGCGGGRGKTIVLIGGTGHEGPGKHAYAEGLERIEALLRHTPETRGMRVVTFKNGWPSDADALQDASTVVLYFDGLQAHPLRNPAHRAQWNALVKRGVGVVALHQASTIPTDGSMPGIAAWLGAERRGTFDRTTESATVTPSTQPHPVARGVVDFTYRDEFYPTLHYAPGAVAVLRSALHPQFRDGAAVLDDAAEPSTVGWAYERPGGGRSFGYTGTHFVAAFDQPQLQRIVLNAILWTAGIDVPKNGATLRNDATPVSTPASSSVHASPFDVPTFHVDRSRSGWHSDQPGLAPERVRDPSFGLAWESPPLDAYEGQPPRVYASPLYVQQLTLRGGPHDGQSFSVVIAASNHGVVYAINAAKSGDIAPGRILWRTRLAPPCHLQPAPLDAVPTGVLSTPIIDRERGRLYVTSCDPEKRWQAYALDLSSGRVLPGWPVQLDEARFNRVNRNAGPERVPPKRRFDFRVQRGALNLSEDGSRLYVTFGETETGWLVAVDTLKPQVASAFAAVAMPHRGSGGIWGAGGPAVDDDGSVFVVTGSGFDGYTPQPHDWTQSVLKLSDSAKDGLTLRGTYTPFNHCTSAKMDIDLGSGGASLLPDLDATATRTPRLMVVGGKQGNAYLLDRAQLPGRLDTRPACDTRAADDGSLLAPTSQPQFGTRGPLNVFGPYSEQDAALDLARARSVPAVFRDADGRMHVVMTGNTKRAAGSSESVPASVVRLSVDTNPNAAAFLSIARRQPTLVLGNPGSPIVSSRGGRDAVVWILDENAPRSASLAGPDAPAPVLYALDAMTLDVLWKSDAGQLHTSGKYNEPVFANGSVVVGTDRIQAFAFGAPPARVAANTTTPAPTASPAKTPVIAAADSGLDGATLFQQRCAMCHDNAQGNIPPRAIITRRSREQIIHALTQGVMRPQAAGLSEGDIESIADYLKQ